MSIIDQQHALNLLGGNQRIYMKFLQKFVDSSKAGKYSISSDLINDDFDHVARTLHAMKGLSENIGALGIKNVASVLDEAAKNNDTRTILSHLDEYNAVLDQVTAEAERILH